MSEEERVRTVLTGVENEMKGKKYVAITGFSGVVYKTVCYLDTKKTLSYTLSYTFCTITGINYAIKLFLRIHLFWA